MDGLLCEIKDVTEVGCKNIWTICIFDDDRAKCCEVGSADSIKG